MPQPVLAHDLNTLAEQYRTGTADPSKFLQSIAQLILGLPDTSVWIHRCELEQIQAQLQRSEHRRAQGIAQPLYGVPFAVKDNIDVAGMPTTAGCPKYAYVPERSATVVQRLTDAGAIVMGKTNLDQFATGLVGTRSPYGVCRNPFNREYISGGSSSGSAVAVASGMVSFALGTDTAGSGRVPAAFNNLVGLKPTHGLISVRGAVPACQSLDCVSIFALSCADARAVLRIAEGFDSQDPYSRRRVDLPMRAFGMQVGVPQAGQRRFFGDARTEALFNEAIERARLLGASIVEIDYSPFAEAANLLYSGPWVAERYLVAGEVMKRDPEAIVPVTRSILARAPSITGIETFDGMHRLAALKQAARVELSKIDMLLVPTAGTIYTIEQVEADPIQLNTNLGYYTNFVNLLDLCAVAVPGGFTGGGLPMGVTLVAPAGGEEALLQFGDRMHRAAGTGAGLARVQPPEMPAEADPTRVRVAVVGAHLSGMPLNYQLTDRGGRLIRATRTAAVYRFFALPGTTPPKPGLVRVMDGPGHSIELEIWELPASQYGSFVAMIPPPLGIGTLELEDGTRVQGFLCESWALSGATDISAYGGWRVHEEVTTVTWAFCPCPKR